MKHKQMTEGLGGLEKSLCGFGFLYKGPLRIELPSSVKCPIECGSFVYAFFSYHVHFARLMSV